MRTGSSSGRAAASARRPKLHAPVDVEREEGHRHQREQAGHGLWRALVRERFEGGSEASLRLLVAAEEVLGGRAARR